MFGPINAIAIDDEPSHLLAITAGLSASGISCTGFWYDRDTQMLNPSPQVGGLQYVRLIFMDLNLDEIAGGKTEPANLAGTVMNVLKQVVAKCAGPYTLVFWTQVGGKAEAVRALIYERLTDIPPPLEILTIDKRAFLYAPPKDMPFNEALKDFYAHMHKNIDELKKAVVDVVTKNAQLSALSRWEMRAAEAAGRTVNEVHACGARDKLPEGGVSESIQRVMAEIARAAAGAIPSSELPARALDVGLVDILVDQFGASVDDPDYQKTIHAAIGQTLAHAIRDGIKFNQAAQMAAELNTFFHVDQEIEHAKPVHRGAVIEAPKTNVLGFRAQELLTREFLFPSELFPDGQRGEINDLIEKCRTEASFVLVELGADCDHAQESIRTQRYLFGVELPETFLRLAKNPMDNKLRNQSLQLLGPWSLNNKISYLLVSCSRFWSSQSPKMVNGQLLKYRLRGSVVNRLLQHYSFWSSRLGIVEFRSS
jgi:hypothetical protein